MDADREVLLGAHGADKVRTNDLHWSMEMIYDSRGLPGVSTVSLEVDGVLQLAPAAWGSVLIGQIFTRDLSPLNLYMRIRPP